MRSFLRSRYLESGYGYNTESGTRGGESYELGEAGTISELAGSPLEGSLCWSEVALPFPLSDVEDC